VLKNEISKEWGGEWLKIWGKAKKFVLLRDDNQKFNFRITCRLKVQLLIIIAYNSNYKQNGQILRPRNQF
ncbi:MAG: hypothetical protein ACI31C_05060, partial [Muribaculaceae bacterium]